MRVPEGWEVVKLGDVARVKGGYAFKSDEFITEGIPIIRISNLDGNRVVTDENICYSEAFLKDNEQYQIKYEDILIAMSGATTGKIGCYLGQSPCPLNQRVGKFEIIQLNRFSNKFLFYILKSEIFKKHVNRLANGCAQPNISNKQIELIEIPLPPLETQKKIASILEKAEKAIQKRKEADELADKYLQSVFVEMFGDPVTNPMGWEVKELASLGSWASGGTPSRNDKSYFDGDIDWYSAGELNKRYLNGSNEKISQRALAESSAKIFESGSMLIGMYDTAAFKMGILKKDSSSNQACANIKPYIESCNINYLYSTLQMMKSYFLSQRRGVRQKNLNLGMIKGFLVPVPPLDLQNKFAQIVEKVETLKQKQKQSGEQLDTLFKSLMQKAFRGEI